MFESYHHHEHMSITIKLNFAKISKLYELEGLNMPREKNQRKLNFKPIVKSFIPEKEAYNGITSLLHEEIEAIYLMDVQGLYQEEAAKCMEVSRPTFTRILKNARQKLAVGIISGNKIEFQDNSKNFIIAICCDEEHQFKNILPDAKYISIYKKTDNEINLIKTISNPTFEKKQKPAIALPNLLQEHNVNSFISIKIGEGLKSTLLMKGINPIEKKVISIEDL